ncbi:NADPH-dependent F420 reductase, partial [Kibdelosporangium lantanae]
LADLSVSEMDSDVLVLGDDREATDQVRALAEAIPGFRGIYGGRLRNAHQVEAFTANLIAINRRYKAHAGIRITDV